MLNFPGLPNQNVPVSATINASPTIDPIPNQTLTNGSATTAVNFTGTNYSGFTWVNDTPGIGLPASGSGNINSFIAINTGNLPVVATITVTPTNTTACNGIPATFTITVNPTVTLTASGTLSPLTTIYGTPSASEIFTVSGTNVSSGILITPPAGFEVSSNGITYNTTNKISGEDISSARVYIRLAATTPAGTYNGNITLSTNYAAGVSVAVPNSEVTPAPLTITADNKYKLYGDANPPLTVTYTGFVNDEGIGQLTQLPDITTTANTLSPIGQYPISPSGAVAPNYFFNYESGLLTIRPAFPALFIPNTFTPNGDGRNDTWEINGLQYYPQSTVNIFNRWGQKVFTSTGYPTPWDGKYNGTTLPSATYYYIINPKNGQPQITGWVMIIK